MIKVLVADADASERKSIAAALTAEQHEVRGAASPDECLSLLKEFQPVLLICDFEWFGSDPAKAIKEWRRGNPLLGVIAIADWGGASEARRAFKFGVYDVLTRPVSDAELTAQVVGRAISWVRMLRERAQLAAMLSKRAEEIERLSSVGKDGAVRDGLTGLANHRIAQETLLECVSAGEQRKEPVSLVYLDIDHFRLYNDSQGYQRGDMLLKAVSAGFRSYARHGDLAARWGGDEFALVMPSADTALAVSVANRIRAAIADMPLPGRESQPGACVTVSIAIATLFEHAANAAGIVAQAEQAMIEAKRLGRNNVQVAAGYAPDAGISSIFSGLHRSLGD